MKPYEQMNPVSFSGFRPAKKRNRAVVTHCKKMLVVWLVVFPWVSLAASQDELAKGLILVGRESTGIKHVAVVKQIRKLAQDYPFTPETFDLLYGNQQSALAYMDDVAELNTIMETGGAVMDSRQIECFDDGWNQTLSVAFVNNPSPEATKGFQKIANNEQEPLLKRKIARLYLAARGDKQKDWMAMVVADFRAGPVEDNNQGRQDFSRYLFYLRAASGKLPDWQAIQKVCVEKLPASNYGEGEIYLNVLQTLANKQPKFDASPEAPQLRAWLDKQFSKEKEFYIHLTLAGLGIDTAKELPQMLTVLGGGQAPPKRIQEQIGWRFGSKTVLHELQKTLTAPDDKVRLGALRVTLMLGPDAQEMLPEIQKLLFDPNIEIRTTARQALQFVAGVDVSGKWNIEVKPEYIELLKKAYQALEK